MKRKNIFLGALLIAVIAVFVWDLLIHLFFSEPFETIGYFLGKFTLYFVFSFFFLAFFKKPKFLGVLIFAVATAGIWGIYYNILPLITGFVPFGIPLSEIIVLNVQNIFFSGFFFGIVHWIGFIMGYYVTAKLIIE